MTTLHGYSGHIDDNLFERTTLQEIYNNSLTYQFYTQPPLSGSPQPHYDHKHMHNEVGSMANCLIHHFHEYEPHVAQVSLSSQGCHFHRQKVRAEVLPSALCALYYSTHCSSVYDGWG